MTTIEFSDDEEPSNNRPPCEMHVSVPDQVAVPAVHDHTPATISIPQPTPQDNYGYGHSSFPFWKLFRNKPQFGLWYHTKTSYDTCVVQHQRKVGTLQGGRRLELAQW